MQFSNRPNAVVYVSRSVAVMVVPIFRVMGSLFVPLGQRAQSVSDSGKFCLPCGYLDWDETGREAAIRETFEEIGLNLSEHLSDQPWFVQSDPAKDARQNVTLRFGAIVDVDDLPALNPSVEAPFVEWREMHQAIDSTDLAFNHAQIIADYYCHQSSLGGA